MQYRLRMLLIVLALGAPFLAWCGWPAMERLIHLPANAESAILREVNFDLLNTSQPDATTR